MCPLSSSVHYILLALLCFCLLCREKEKPDEWGHLERRGGGESDREWIGCKKDAGHTLVHNEYTHLFIVGLALWSGWNKPGCKDTVSCTLLMLMWANGFTWHPLVNWSNKKTNFLRDWKGSISSQFFRTLRQTMAFTTCSSILICHSVRRFGPTCVCLCACDSICSILHTRSSMWTVFGSLSQSPSISRALIQSGPLSQSGEGWPPLLASQRQWRTPDERTKGDKGSGEREGRTGCKWKQS